MIPGFGGQADLLRQTVRRVDHSGTGPTQGNESVRKYVLGQILSMFCTGAAGTPEPLQWLMGKYYCWACTTMI